MKYLKYILIWCFRGCFSIVLSYFPSLLATYNTVSIKNSVLVINTITNMQESPIKKTLDWLDRNISQNGMVKRKITFVLEGYLDLIAKKYQSFEELTQEERYAMWVFCGWHVSGLVYSIYRSENAVEVDRAAQEYSNIIRDMTPKIAVSWHETAKIHYFQGPLSKL